MSTARQYPYDTRLNVLHRSLELIDITKLAASAPHKWYNQTLCAVNGSVVRLGVIEGGYHWHKHDHDDEFFYVVEGELLIDLEGRKVSGLARARLRSSQRRAPPHGRPTADHHSHG